jgi:hypothetical protein
MAWLCICPIRAEAALHTFAGASAISPLAVDSSGNSYFVVTGSSGTNTLYEATSSGALTILNSNFPYFPTAIAVTQDGSRLFFVYSGATYSCGGNNNNIYIATAPTSSGVSANFSHSVTFSGYTFCYADPSGLATDASGNLYLTDFGGAEIYKFNAPVTATSAPSGFLTPNVQMNGIVVSGGTIYFLALNLSSQSTLYSVPSSAFGTAVPQSVTTPSTIVSNLPGISSGLSIDSSGALYVGGSPAAKIVGGTQTPLTVPLSSVSGLAVQPGGTTIFLTGQDSNGNIVLTTATSGSAVNGVCGSAANMAVISAPIGNLCQDSSTPAVTAGATQFTWTCAGQNGGQAANCSAPRQYTVTPIPGAHGSLNCTSPVTAGNPTTCSATPAGGYITLSISGCGGTATGSGTNSFTTGAITANCTVSATFGQIVNGACGSAANTPVLSAPSSNLCQDNSTPAVTTGATQFSWTCAGQNTGTSANCAAPREFTVSASPGAHGTLSCPSPVTAGNTTTCTATPASGYGTLSISGCGGTATGSGINGYTTAAVNANCTVTATFAQSMTATMLSSSASGGSVFGQSVTFTATVTPQAPATIVATGTVTFYDGSTQLGTGSLNGSGQTSYTTAGLGVGPHTISATYGGDSNYLVVAPNNYSSTSAAQSQPVSKAATATTLTPPLPVTLGQSTAFVASVLVSSPGAGTPTGTITIADTTDGLTCSYALGGAPGCSLTPTSAGAKSITASYGGDGNFNGSSTSAGTLTVNPNASATSISASPNPTVFGQSTTFTASVSSANPNATGSINFAEAGTALPGCSAVPMVAALPATSPASYTAQCQISSLTVGSHSIGATYVSGDGNTLGSSVTTPASIVVATAATNVTLTSPAPITLGNSTLVSASVSVTLPGHGTPTGMVTIADGGSGTGDSCTFSLPASGCSLTPSSAGGKVLTATYVPDVAASASFTGNSTTGSLTVNPSQPGTALASTANPSVFGQNVTFTATITPASGGLIPGGTVTFSDGATTLCNAVALTAGSGSASAPCTTSMLAAAAHSITASYSGDNNNQASTANLTQTVNPAATVTTIVPPSAIALGGAVTVHVSVVASAPGAGTPAGTVTVSDGSASCPVTLDAGGTGSCVLTPPAPAGNQQISAVYTATTDFASSTGSAILTVNAAPAGTTLTSSANPSIFGGNVTFTATVTPTSGNPVPTGTVDFLDGGTKLCSAIALSGGTATCSTAVLAIGAHVIQSNYGGDTNTVASSATLAQNVNLIPTGMTLTASPPAVMVGTPLTLTATVVGSIPSSAKVASLALGESAKSAAAAGAASGTVTFSDGATVIGSVALDPSGIASLTIPALSIGKHVFTAVYASNGVYTTAQATVTAEVDGPAVSAPVLSAGSLLLLAFAVACIGARMRMHRLPRRMRR